MIENNIKFSDGCSLTEGWGSKSCCRSDSGYSFSPGDKIRVSHPNARNKKHRDKTGIVLDRYTKNNQVWIEFSDSSLGSVNLIALVPIENQIALN